MPRLWTDTIETHRREVRDAVLDTTATLAAEHGLLAVTMSQIAERTGIGRATLYKYFRDVESILIAWHERKVGGHLAHLSRVRDEGDDPASRLRAVLEAYALIDYEHHGGADHDRHVRDLLLDAVLHKGGHVARAEAELGVMVRDLIAGAARAGEIRDDIAPAELAIYCLGALGASRMLRSKAAVGRLVDVTLAGLRAPC